MVLQKNLELSKGGHEGRGSPPEEETQGLDVILDDPEPPGRRGPATGSPPAEEEQDEQDEQDVSVALTDNKPTRRGPATGSPPAEETKGLDVIIDDPEPPGGRGPATGSPPAEDSIVKLG